MMHLFVCSRCQNVDYVELAGYVDGLPRFDEHLCTKCRTGEWHDQFPEEKYDYEIHVDVINRPSGFGLG